MELFFEILFVFVAGFMFIFGVVKTVEYAEKYGWGPITALRVLILLVVAAAGIATLLHKLDAPDPRCVEWEVEVP